MIASCLARSRYPGMIRSLSHAKPSSSLLFREHNYVAGLLMIDYAKYREMDES